MTALCKRSQRSGSGLRLSATFYYETEKAGYGSGEDHTRLSEPLGGADRAVEEKAYPVIGSTPPDCMTD